MTELVSDTRVWVDDPVKAFAAGMLKNAVDAIEGLIANENNPLLFAEGRLANRARRDHVRPVIDICSWLADPDPVGITRISLAHCCDACNLDLDFIMERMQALLRKVPPNGIAAINQYVERLLSDSVFARYHYESPWWKDSSESE